MVFLGRTQSSYVYLVPTEKKTSSMKIPIIYRQSLKMCKNKGWGYYSSFLKFLFFEGFAKKPQERTPKAKKILGNIKYLNGGLFVPHSIEEKYGAKIDIKDKAFEDVFRIFSRYDWHGEDSRGGTNEISPDVLGHIFEKYINDSQKKEPGGLLYPRRDNILSRRKKH